MGDRGRAVVLQYAGVIVVKWRSIAVPSHSTRTDNRAGIGKCLGQGMNENQLGAANANNIACLQNMIPHDPLSPNHCAVAAIQVAQDPLPAGKENFDVVSAATIIVEDNLVGGRTTDGRRL